MSSILIQDTNKAKRPVYFIRKVFRCAEERYQKIEKLTLAIVVAVRKLCPYFQGHTIFVKTNYPV